MKPMDKQDKIRRENRRKLPGFLLLIVMGGVLGITIGVFSNWLNEAVAPDTLARQITLALGFASPAFPLLCIPFLAIAFWHLHRSRQLFSLWDGDDERLPDQIEHRLNWAMLWINVSQFLVFLGLGLDLSLMPLGAISYASAFTILILSMAALFFCITLQRQVVDLSRRMNPEKQGSVYDVKFRKKWYDSCDEAERRRIGEAAYTAYIVVSYTSVLLWVITALLNIFIPVGPLPMVVAILPWGIGQLTYLIHSIRAGK